MDHLPSDLIGLVEKLFAALTPSAIGALIGTAHERGLAWRDRLLAYITGITVSYYVTLGMAAIVKLDPFATQAVAFVIGMIAYKATPRFIASASDAIAGLPEMLKGWLDRFGARPK